MKKVKNYAVIFTAFTLLAACNPLGKMAKNYGMINYNLNPNPVEMHADSIEITINGKFPANYFHKKAFVEITPVLKYPAGSEVTTTKELKKITFRGEATDGEGNMVKYSGGGFNYSDKIAYGKDMEGATLELRATGKFKTSEKVFDDVKIGDGTIITPLLVKGDDKPIAAKDKFIKVKPKSFNADIHYLVSSHSVRSNELRQDDIKALKEFVKNGSENGLVFKGVKVSAYASPDGEVAMNENLATDRANSASKALVKIFKKAKVEAASAEGFYNNTGKGEDWDGFRKSVKASDIEDKDLIIRVLEMTSDVNKREQEIKNMAKTYLVLANKILPQLRRSQITINAEEKSLSDEEIKNLAATAPDSLEVEELFYAATLTEDMNEKLKIYQTFSKQFPNDWRGPNNIGYIYMMQNKLNNAKGEFSKAMNISSESAIVKNNMGVVTRLMGDKVKAWELYESAMSAGPEVAYNMGIINIMNGDYSSAVSNLSGSNSFNEALANLLNGNAAEAINIIDASDEKTSAMGYYLKSICGARQKSIDMIVSNLKNAIDKDGTLSGKAKRDAEFISYREDPKFKELTQ